MTEDEKFAIAFEKWNNDEELTPEEEQMILDMLNDENSEFPTGPKP